MLWVCMCVCVVRMLCECVYFVYVLSVYCVCSGCYVRAVCVLYVSVCTCVCVCVCVCVLYELCAPSSPVSRAVSFHLISWTQTQTHTHNRTHTVSHTTVFVSLHTLTPYPLLNNICGNRMHLSRLRVGLSVASATSGDATRLSVVGFSSRGSFRMSRDWTATL